MTEEKPFEATPRRIARAKREGNVARGGELAANCGFAASAFCVSAVTPMIAGLAAAALRHSLRAAAPVHAATAVQCATIAGAAILAIAAAAVGGTIAHLFAQGGLTLVAPAWKLERLDPVAGLRRIASRETLAHSLRALCAFSCAVVAMGPVLEGSVFGIAGSTTIDEAVVRAWSDARRLAFVACAVGFIFSFAEFGAARKAWLQRLRMSFEERKRELKEDEGDASARGRRRQLHRALLRGGVNRVKEAAFVVVNPTHVAIAMAYRPPTVAVPMVLVAAADAAALRVRAIATKHDIPIVENPALARALYHDARAGFAIPHAFYVAVADVVAALLRQGALSA
jgi:flagellar biosynthesis protein FlhB